MHETARVQEERAIAARLERLERQREEALLVDSYHEWDVCAYAEAAGSSDEEADVLMTGEFFVEYLDDPIGLPDFPDIVTHIDAIDGWSEEDIDLYLRYDADEEEWEY